MYKKRGMLPNENYGFCYSFLVWGFPRRFSVVLSPLSGWVLQGSFGGSPFSVHKKGGNAVDFFVKTKFICLKHFLVILVTFLGSPGGSLWFSVHSVAGFCRVLSGVLLFQCMKKGKCRRFVLCLFYFLVLFV